MTAPLSDAIVFTMARLVDDSQSAAREFSHSKLDFLINRAALSAGDPRSQGQSVVGKSKRVTATLSWALEHDPRGGQALVAAMIAAPSLRWFSPEFAEFHR